MPRESDTVLAVYANTSYSPQVARRDSYSVGLALHGAVNWFERWHFRDNVGKIVAVRFTRKTDTLDLADRRLPWSVETKYLGAHLDFCLTVPHIGAVMQRAATGRSLLAPLLNAKSCLNLGNKLLLCNQFLRPALTYAALESFDSVKTYIDRLEVFKSAVAFCCGASMVCSESGPPQGPGSDAILIASLAGCSWRLTQPRLPITCC